jgi:tetratricopeptide (TPR) repeat protein
MSQAPSTPKVDELRARLKADPKNRLFYPLAEELRKVGQLAEAEQVLRAGLTHHPTYLSAWVCMGRVLRDQQKDREAVDALTTAMQVDPGNVVAARLMADAYLNLGEKVEAIKKYKLVQALLPADEELKGVIERLSREIAMPTGVPVAAAEPEEEPEQPPAAPAPEPQAAGAQASPSPFQTETFAPFHAEPAPSAPVFEPPPMTDDWADSSNPLGLSAVSPLATGDAEPMLAAHDSSPFEEPLHESYSSAAAAIEAPQGMQIVDAPLSAEVAAPWSDEPEPAQSAYYDDEPVSDEPVASEPPPPEDLINTITMADLYERQGLTDQARRIYENILARDPENHEIRARLERHSRPEAAQQAAAGTPRERKIAALESWLSRVARSEASHV